MVAVFDINLDTGGTIDTPGAQTSIVPLGPPNLRYKRADNPTIDNANPNIIPAAGTTFSRWKQIYLIATTAPDTSVNNVKIFTDGTGFGTGITVNIGDQLPPRSSASTLGYDPADTDDDTMTNHSDITSVTDFFTFTSVAAKSVTISETSSLINAIGETTNYVVTQMLVINTAAPGDLTNETITWEYDEI